MSEFIEKIPEECCRTCYYYVPVNECRHPKHVLYIKRTLAKCNEFVGKSVKLKPGASLISRVSREAFYAITGQTTSQERGKNA